MALAPKLLLTNIPGGASVGPRKIAPEPGAQCTAMGSELTFPGPSQLEMVSSAAIGARRRLASPTMAIKVRPFSKQNSAHSRDGE